MEMAGKQFCPFMEMVVQLCLTACATHGLTACTTVSYKLCNYVLRLWKWLCNCVLRLVQPTVLQLVQLCLTSYVTASYSLWKWLASSSFHLWKRFYKWYERNQRLHKKLGNSENTVTYRLR
jgi:hypothetical protein